VAAKKRKSGKQKKGRKDVEAMRKQNLESDTLSTRASEKRKAVPEVTGLGMSAVVSYLSYLSISFARRRSKQKKQKKGDFFDPEWEAIVKKRAVLKTSKKAPSQLRQKHHLR
jgi:hypothetical protein